jgi:hypothetical protein
MNGNLIEVFGDLREGDVVARRCNDESGRGHASQSLRVARAERR